MTAYPTTGIVPETAGSGVLSLRGQSQAPSVAQAFLLGYSGNTRKSYAQDLKTWFQFCSEQGCDPLASTRAQVDAYARQMSEVYLRSPATVARRLTALSGYFKYAVDEDLLPRNPCVQVRRPRTGDSSVSTGLDRDELTAMLEASRVDKRSCALVTLLTFNGLRISESLGANVEDLGTERGHRTLKITRKGGRIATIPLAPRTAQVIDEYLNGRHSGPLFTTRTGGRYHRSEAWRKIRQLAKVGVPEKADSLGPHGFRHTFVTLSLDAGIPLQEVQDAAGHRSPETTQRYNRARFNLDRHPTYALAGVIG